MSLNSGLGAYLETVRQAILLSTGVPVSIGVGRTKTLAKVAAFQAKKLLRQPVCILGEHVKESGALKTTPVEEVWGVGRRWAARLLGANIETAWDLSLQPPNAIRRCYSSVLADTVRELQGTPCLPLGLMANAKKNIMSSRSFGQGIRSYGAIAEALANYAARACEKLRQQRSLAKEIAVFLKTNRFKQNGPYYAPSICVPLPTATSDTATIVHHAKLALKQIYRPGLEYHKAGLLLCNLVPDSAPEQLDLFAPLENAKPKNTGQVSCLMDSINAKFKKNVIYLGAQKTQQKENWQLRCNFKSPHYTTDWQSLLKAHAAKDHLLVLKAAALKAEK